jgi:hypothetical protein
MVRFPFEISFNFFSGWRFSRQPGERLRINDGLDSASFARFSHADKFSQIN